MLTESTQRVRSCLSVLALSIAWHLPAMAAIDVPDAAAAARAAAVLQIFEARCTKCHGSDVQKPKGKFGYVTDLGRVAANPDMVEPLKPENSELFLLVRDGEMPPPKSKISRLTADEVAAVRLWIDRGAVVSRPDLQNGSTVESTGVDGAGDAEARRSGGGGLLQWLGRWHPASVHLPIGLILGAALAELLSILFSGVDLRGPARYCIALGAVFAVLSACLGWWNAESPFYASPDSSELFWHRWTGVATALAALLTLLLSEWLAWRPGPRLLRVYRIALFVTAALVATAGFLGGANVYGLDHYFGSAA